ncbi:hypothetical protein EV421DRAFT_1892498 [Armillaria borealis]|uniref:TRP C-terminal domain-containing protein n=1 Tax=Armillaria borealis TaxID=47425 RepID=A0AA39J5M1_9AGAR|nr:hypothetical protein EV421DRAFT_1892498 [Armillaria borealis]
MFSASSLVTFEAAGLLVLADLPAVALRTALTGRASFLDALVLQCADEINRGECPMTGAMTSGYVFRVENPATMSYLQSICQPRHSSGVSKPFSNMDLSLQNRVLQSLFVVQATVLYFLCPISTITVFALLALGMFVLARLINVAGSINELKAVTAGHFAVLFATTVVYASAIPAFNASSLLIRGLLLCFVTLLTLCNSLTQCFQMYNCVVRMEGKPVQYRRRLEMAEKLVGESNREDWAVGMGLVLPKIGSNRTVTV